MTNDVRSVDAHPGTHASQEVIVTHNVPAKMRDGVTLRANVYRPTGPGPWSTLLTRHPYCKDDPRQNTLLFDPVAAARRGFMVVVQDTRGRFSSDGEWAPFRYERSDGYDTVEWAARLPGSSGKVGTYGASYFGNTQWTAALSQPPSLAAICPAMTWSEPLDGFIGRGGAFQLGIALRWSLQTGVGHIAKLPLAESERAARIEALFDEFDRLHSDGYWHLPASDTSALRRCDIDGHPTIAGIFDPDVPQWCRVAGEHNRVQVPSMNIGGWYDTFLQGTIDNYTSMVAQGQPSRLVIGPWTHEERTGDPIGELWFGVRSSGYGVPVHNGQDLSDIQLNWLAGQLGMPGAVPDSEREPVRIFVMGRNQWRDEPAWPIARARTNKWFLTEGGGLTRNAPTLAAGPTEFQYDPANPVLTLGGGAELPHYQPGAFDQRRVEERSDVCVFTSEPLDRNLEITGRVRLRLHAASSAPSTDWIARLCDVYPDGRSFNICDGILRVAHGADAPSSYEIDLWSTSNMFLRGHRLRVQVTNSCFPRWDRNLNTGRQDEARFAVARQIVFHDVDHASYIELPVIP
jgi:uncharacterized protein